MDSKSNRSERSVAVKIAPAGIEASAVERMLHELLDQFSREEQSLNLEICTRIAASIACHAAIKVNMPLEQNKMEWLLGCSRIFEGMLPFRQTVFGADKCSNKSRDEQSRTLWIHQAESDVFQESARILDGLDGLAIQPPPFLAQLLEFEIGHTKQLSNLRRPSQSH